MQLLSLAALGPEAQRVFEELSFQSGRNYSSALVVFGGITFALWVVAAWVGAQSVMKENPGAGAAVQTGFLWLAGYLFAIALGGASFYFATLRGSETMASASLAIGGILFLYTALSVPMKIHRISIFKAFGFALIGLVIHLAGQLIVQKAMDDPLDLRSRFLKVRHLVTLSPEDASKVLTALRKPAAATPPAKTIVERPPTPAPKSAEELIAERHGELKKVYADLMARREMLHEGEDAALAAYTRDTVGYVEQLAQLQRDSDALKK